MADQQLIDTSAWIEYFRRDGDPNTRERVAESVRSQRAVFCDMVFLELMRGNRRQHEKARLVAETLPHLATDGNCWKKAVDVASRASEAGKPVPNTDLLIFACGRAHQAEIIHRDGHFDTLEALAD